ncbi:MAG: hypothetical protein U0800_05630 [Isosphaeraceae bacterium]
MNRQVFEALRPVRRRMRQQLVVRCLGLGLLVGGLAGLLLGAYRIALAPSGSIPAWLIGLAMAPAPLIGAMVGLFWPLGWRLAAITVDDRYKLKDRTRTAVSFLEHGPSRVSPLHELQVADANEHLKGVSAREAVPFRWPRSLLAALASTTLAALLLAMPLHRKAAAEPAAPDPAVQAAAEHAEENLKDLEALAEEKQDEELKELVQELKQQAEEMKEPGVDAREAMAKLSEMQQSIMGLQAKMNVGLVDGQMRSLGEAMTSAEALESAGSALQEGKFDKAAELLDEPIDPSDLDRKEARTLKEKLKKVAEASDEAGLGEMAGAITEMIDGLDEPHSGKFQGGSKKLAKMSRKQAARSKIKEILDMELENLEECKGECKGDKAIRVRMPSKSDSASANAGAVISGNTEGEKTDLNAARQREEITGNPGEGPSEVETIHSPEGRQTARRSYKDAYDRARARSEAALESEPIPLGHRQTIRRYFELIRPSNEAPSDKPAEPQP